MTTVEPGSAEPRTMPVPSTMSSNASRTGAAGASVSTSTVVFVCSEVLPALSCAISSRSCAPSVSGSSSSIEKSPSSLASPRPSSLPSSSRMITVEPGSAVPVIGPLPSARSDGLVTTGAVGASVSTSTVVFVSSELLPALSSATARVVLAVVERFVEFDGEVAVVVGLATAEFVAVLVADDDGRAGLAVPVIGALAVARSDGLVTTGAVGALVSTSTVVFVGSEVFRPCPAR